MFVCASVKQLGVFQLIRIVLRGFTKSETRMAFCSQRRKLSSNCVTHGANIHHLALLCVTLVVPANHDPGE
jgi:hypothetical protein